MYTTEIRHTGKNNSLFSLHRHHMDKKKDNEKLQNNNNSSNNSNSKSGHKRSTKHYTERRVE